MCTKAKYNSQVEANIHIAKIRRHSSRSKIPKRSYWCKDCRGYHLTSRA